MTVTMRGARLRWTRIDAIEGSLLTPRSGIPFARADVIAYFDKISRDGYPAVHHSEAFRNAYHPAYRVIAIDLLQK